MVTFRISTFQGKCYPPFPITLMFNHEVRNGSHCHNTSFFLPLQQRSTYAITLAPTKAPTLSPTPAPTVKATPAPTVAGGTPPPTKQPTAAPTNAPTKAPTKTPTTPPSAVVVGGQSAGITTHPSYPECNTNKWSFKCGTDIFTCGFPAYEGPTTTRPVDMCNSQPLGTGGIIKEIDYDTGYCSAGTSLCSEMIGKLMAQPFGGTDIKCGETCTTLNNGRLKCTSNSISNWVCYPPNASKTQLKKVDWSNGQVETNCAN
jgi:hypothetical protein